MKLADNKGTKCKSVLMLERKELEGNLQFVKATRKFVDEPKTGVIFSLRETLQRKARRILSCPRR